MIVGSKGVLRAIKLVVGRFGWSKGLRSRENVDSDASRVLLLRAELKTLLDVHPLARQVVRHLAYLEWLLATRGPRAWAEVPLDVLVTALGQLNTLVADRPGDGLGELRLKMSNAVAGRSEKSPRRGNGARPSEFGEDVLVHEASHSMFMELLGKQYEGLIPAETIRAGLGPSEAEQAQIVTTEQSGRRHSTNSPAGSQEEGFAPTVPWSLSPEEEFALPFLPTEPLGQEFAPTTT